jgi:hypothetical protein
VLSEDPDSGQIPGWVAEVRQARQRRLLAPGSAPDQSDVEAQVEEAQVEEAQVEEAQVEEAPVEERGRPGPSRSRKKRRV